MPRPDAFSRAQDRWDAMEPPEGPDIEDIREAGERSAPEFDSYLAWIDVLERRFRVPWLWEDRGLDDIWKTAHPEEKEEE